MWPICAANCAIHAARESIRRSVLFINPQPTATGARRQRSFRGTTLWPGVAISSIGPSGEPARAARSGSSARGIPTDALSSVMPVRSFWTKRVNNPIRHKLFVTEGVGNGFKSATLQKRPFATALSERAGAGCGGKAFRIPHRSHSQLENHRQKSEASPQRSPSHARQDPWSSYPFLFLPRN